MPSIATAIGLFPVAVAIDGPLHLSGINLSKYCHAMASSFGAVD